ncbi:DUF3857 domain-containing protein [bacterium]|nr:MAG: DUF3857 domain-containing protein [bacterium]
MSNSLTIKKTGLNISTIASKTTVNQTGGKMRFLQTVFVLGVTLLFSTGCASFKEISETQKTYGLRRMPNAEDFPNSDAVTVIESHFIDMNFDTNDNIYTVEETHVVQRVFRNFDKYANVEIMLDHDDKLMSIEARTINPEGEVVTLLSTDFHTATGVTYESEFISDRKAIRFAFKNVQAGSVLEYKCRILSDFAYGGVTWHVQQDIPVILNVMKLSVPTYLVDKLTLLDENQKEYKWDWIYKAYGMDIGQPTVERPLSNQVEDEQKYIFTWKLKKIHSFQREPFCPPYTETVGHVRFATKTSWNGIAKRYMDRFWNPQALITPKVLEKTNRIIEGVSSDEEKVRLLSNYVKSIRYTAIQLGDGGYRPRKPQEVIDTQYGDCKDKSTLLITMLRSIGIVAKPVLVRTYNRGQLDPEFQGMGWFNHMIAKVELPDQTLWIDPTSENSQFGELPWLDEGVWVCVLDSNKAQIEKTPVRDQNQNKMDVKIQAVLFGESGMNFHFVIEHYGNWALFLSNELKDLSLSDLQKYCKSLVADEFLNSKIQNIKLSKREGIDKPLTLEFDAVMPNAIQQQGDLCYAKIDPFKMFESMTWLSSENRRYPIRYSYPYSVHKTVQIKLSDAYKVRNLPKTLKLSTYDLDYMSSYENQSDSELIFKEDYAVKSREIPASEYQSIQTFFSRIQNSSAEKVVLTK